MVTVFLNEIDREECMVKQGVGNRYPFSPPLREGLIKSRRNRFEALVEIDGEVAVCHCPVTGRIGDIVLKDISCLFSQHDNAWRKTKYTIEAISLDPPEHTNKHWIGINQVFSNRLIEFFIQTRQLPFLDAGEAPIRREVSLGPAKLDFLVASIYVEVKTPLTVLQVVYGPHVQTKAATPFASGERFMKHVGALADALKSHERSILLTVHQYLPTQVRPWPKSAHFPKIAAAVEKSIQKGVEFFDVDILFTPDGAELSAYKNITPSVMDLIKAAMQ